MIRRALLILLAATIVLMGVPGIASADQAIRIGTPFHTDTASRCATAFAVRHASLGDGFLASRACGEVGDVVYLSPSVRFGEIRLVASAPTWLWIDLDDGWRAIGELPDGSPIGGGAEAPVGASVCRYGPTTGWYCGVVQAKNVTVSFPQGVVTGVTRTNICPEPGALGSVVVSGTQAQGIGIGGSGSCSSGGTSYFYPIGRIVAEAPGLSLITV